MKKNIFRMTSFAVAMAAMTSCSDDLGLESSKFKSNADLVATLITDDSTTRLGMSEVEGKNPWAEGNDAGWKWVFTENDQLRVFTMESMLYQSYDLIAGAGTGEGEFNVTSESPTLPAGAEKYAITDAQFVYGVSPEPDGTPKLTYTIPYMYKAQTYSDGNGVNVQKLPAPFWGNAKTEDADGSNGGKLLETSLWATTAFLRINMDVLPKGTKYIVLTTHGSVTKDDNNALEYDGFQLLTPNPDDLTQVLNKEGNYVDYVDNDEFWAATADTITDGNSEPISGTFSALLTGKGKGVGGVNTGAYLKADDGGDVTEGISRLVTKDEIVIDVNSLENNGVFWIPLIPQHYNNLYVMAVTKMSKKSYKYIGTMLNTYTDVNVLVGQRRHMEMNLTNLGVVCAHELNEAIKRINKANKYGMVAENVINVDELKKCNHTYTKDGVTEHGHIDMYFSYGFPCDQILVQGEGNTNLTINIKKISAEVLDKGDLSPVLNDPIDGKKSLFVSDHNYLNGDTWSLHNGSSSTTTKSVRINVPFDAPTTGQPSATATTADALFADLLNTDAIFAANTNFAPAAQTAGKDFRIDVRGAATECVNGRELMYIVNDVASTEELKNGTDAAVTVESGFGQVNVLTETKGDVYVTGLASDQKVELAEGLFIYTKAGVNVRMDNALSKVVGFPAQPNDDNHLITTGSSAVQAVGIVPANLGETTLQNGTPNKLSLQSYWTGYALDVEAENIKDYDVATVYTVAQLASMGEEITNPGGQDASDTNEYTISELLENMWLGGKNFGWVGAAVTVDEFAFDGNGVALLNMWMPKTIKDSEIGMSRTIWVKDPHICCTSCGWNRESAGTETIGASQTVPMTSFGLIRSIVNSDGATINNVALNDVNAEQYDAVCDYIGSLVGVINTDGELSMDNNSVGEIRINVMNDYVGGLVGQVINASEIVVNKNIAGNSQYNTGYVKGVNYVGGMFGKIGTDATNVAAYIPTTIQNSTVDLAGDIAASASYAGGLIGDALVADNLDLINDNVTVQNITAGENYAAGFIGNLDSELNNSEAANVDAAVVKVKETISAGNQYAAGLIAYDKFNALNVISSDIKANSITAENGFVGGEIAYIPFGKVIFGYSKNEDDRNTLAKGVKENKVVVNTLKSCYSVGGLVGNNDNNATVDVRTCESNTGATISSTNVNITKFENSKSDLVAFFNPSGTEQKSHLAGTMSNIVGKVDGNLYIDEYGLTVEDNLVGTMKEAIGYQLHNDQNATPSQNNRLFWGDYNGYVGFGKTGRYYLTNKKYGTVTYTSSDRVVADQGGTIDGFNLYKSAEDYETAKSKWQN